MTRTPKLEVELDTTAGYVVALPPSSLDPAEDEMRVIVNGVEVIREYDPDLEQP